MICSSLLKKPSTFLTYIDLSILFNLNHCFLTNSKLMTNPVALLSNNASTVTPSCILVPLSQIFTVTSLSISLLSRLQQDLLSITLKSIANLSVLEYNQELLDSLSHLNHYSYCLNFSYTSSFSFVLLFHNSCSFLQYDQNSHNYSNSFLYPSFIVYGLCLDMNSAYCCKYTTTAFVFLLLLLEQILLAPAVSLGILAKLGVPSISFLPFYSISSAYPNLLSAHITALCFWIIF